MCVCTIPSKVLNPIRRNLPVRLCLDFWTIYDSRIPRTANNVRHCFLAWCPPRNWSCSTWIATWLVGFIEPTEQRDSKQTKTDQGQKRNHKKHKERPRKNTELAIMVFVNGTNLLARRFVPLAAAVTPARPVPAPPIVLLLLFCAPPKFMPVVVVGGTTPSNTIRKKKGRNF